MITVGVAVSGVLRLIGACPSGPVHCLWIPRGVCRLTTVTPLGVSFQLPDRAGLVAADARQRLAATLDALQQREGSSPATPSSALARSTSRYLPKMPNTIDWHQTTSTSPMRSVS